ncbi:MAG: 30S ribosomal protein S19 [Candidatus Woesearchaeota archaeon]
MAKKEFSFYGKTLEELKKMSMNEFMDVVPSRQKRSLKRGLTDQQKILLKKIKSGKKEIKTHVRDMVILPVMEGLIIKIYKGNSFQTVRIMPEMIGKFLGEFTYNRKKVEHSAPGVGATRSSASISVK